MSEVSAERLNLAHQNDRGGLNVRNRHFGPVRAVDCSLSVGSSGAKTRSYLERCVFSQVKAERCVVGYPIFKECVFKNIKADFLQCYNALFLDCKLEGIIDGINFGLQPKLTPASSTVDPVLMKESERLLSQASFSLDVREAVLADVVFWGPEIVPYVLFNPGQCAIFRGEHLDQKLEGLGKEIRDRSLQDAILTASPGPRDTLSMVSLESCGASERIADLRNIVSKVGIELLDHPLVKS